MAMPKKSHANRANKAKNNNNNSNNNRNTGNSYTRGSNGSGAPKMVRGGNRANNNRANTNTTTTTSATAVVTRPASLVQLSNNMATKQKAHNVKVNAKAAEFDYRARAERQAAKGHSKRAEKLAAKADAAHQTRFAAREREAAAASAVESSLRVAAHCAQRPRWCENRRGPKPARVSTRTRITLPANVTTATAMVIYTGGVWRLARSTDPAPCSYHRIVSYSSPVEVTFSYSSSGGVLSRSRTEVVYADAYCSKCGQHFFSTYSGPTGVTTTTTTTSTTTTPYGNRSSTTYIGGGSSNSYSYSSTSTVPVPGPSPYTAPPPPSYSESIARELNTSRTKGATIPEALMTPGAVVMLSNKSSGGLIHLNWLHVNLNAAVIAGSKNSRWMWRVHVPAVGHVQLESVAAPGWFIRAASRTRSDCCGVASDAKTVFAVVPKSDGSFALACPAVDTAPGVVAHLGFESNGSRRAPTATGTGDHGSFTVMRVE